MELTDHPLISSNRKFVLPSRHPDLYRHCERQAAHRKRLLFLKKQLIYHWKQRKYSRRSAKELCSNPNFNQIRESRMSFPKVQQVSLKMKTSVRTLLVTYLKDSHGR